MCAAHSNKIFANSNQRQWHLWVAMNRNELKNPSVLQSLPGRKMCLTVVFLQGCSWKPVWFFFFFSAAAASHVTVAFRLSSSRSQINTLSRQRPSMWAVTWRTRKARCCSIVLWMGRLRCRTIKLFGDFGENISHISAPNMQTIPMQITTRWTRICSLLKNTQKKNHLLCQWLKSCRTLSDSILVFISELSVLGLYKRVKKRGTNCVSSAFGLSFNHCVYKAG